jgi:hypothetical protein
MLDDKAPWRPQFAAWATSAENKYFAPAFVNRLWANFFGRGFVNPVDNFHADNPASHPELLQRLADEFKSSGHDIKHLFRCLCNSQAYQRTSKPLPQNEADAALFSHMAIKPLSPDAFYDSLIVLNSIGRNGGKNSSREQFLSDFRTQEGADGVFSHGIPQFLKRMNGEEFNSGAAIIDQLRSASRDQAIESLYLATLARRPTADEVRLMSAYLAKRNNSQGYQGVLWILLNSGEFVLNH